MMFSHLASMVQYDLRQTRLPATQNFYQAQQRLRGDHDSALGRHDSPGSRRRMLLRLWGHNSSPSRTSPARGSKSRTSPSRQVVSHLCVSFKLDKMQMPGISVWL